MLALAMAGALVSAGPGPALVEKVSWGAPVGGLRLGLSLSGSLPDSTLKVTVENAGSTERHVYVAFGITTRFQFTATAPDGKEFPMMDRNVFVPSAGGPKFPVVDRIGPGASREYLFPLSRILYLFKSSEWLTLDALVRRGYAVCVSLEGSEDRFKTDGVPLQDDLWTGSATSGEVRVP